MSTADGSVDSSVMEEEIVYVRTAKAGQVRVDLLVFRPEWFGTSVFE